MPKRKGQSRKMSRKRPHVSDESDPSAKRECDMCKGSKPLITIKYLFGLLLQMISCLDVKLCSVGKDAGAVFGYLKLFGIKLGIELSELFEISQKPICPADYPKVLCYGGIVVLLCYFGAFKSKSPPSMHHRLSGIAVVAAILDFFWTILSPLPVLYRVCFACVSVLFVAVASKITT